MSVGGLYSVKVEDDAGMEHIYELPRMSVFVALERILPKVREHASKDTFDQVVEGVLGSFSGAAEVDEVEVALSRCADVIATSGDLELIKALFEGVARDGKTLNAAGMENAYSRNFGELQRALAAVLTLNFKDYFARRVTQLRSGGLRHVEQLIQSLSERVPSWLASATSAMSGQSGSLHKVASVLTKSDTAGLFAT